MTLKEQVQQALVNAQSIPADNTVIASLQSSLDLINANIQGLNSQIFAASTPTTQALITKRDAIG